MQRSLATILPALLDIWFWEPPGWTSSIEEGVFVVRDGDRVVVAKAPLTDARAVKLLTSWMNTVNLINDNLESFRDPYRADTWFSELLVRVREVEQEAAELSAENARLHARLEALGHADDRF